ncbi:MAG: hypothetical protein Q8876_06880 [Bacillota bacterium]|nr:hypothetical protein [Bacillota bacterium]
MKCQLIFYQARKTGYNESAFQMALRNTPFEISDISSAGTAKDFGKQLNESFRNCDLTFICGGLNSESDENIGIILSYAIQNSQIKLSDVRKIKNEIGDDGYLVRSENGTLIVLPDSPEEIEAMIDKTLLNYLYNVYQICID